MDREVAKAHSANESDLDKEYSPRLARDRSNTQELITVLHCHVIGQGGWERPLPLFMGYDRLAFPIIQGDSPQASLVGGRPDDYLTFTHTIKLPHSEF